MNLRDVIQNKLTAIAEETLILKALLERLPEAGVHLESGAINVSVCGDTLDFDNPKRGDVVRLMSALKAGKWNKEPGVGQATINYVSDAPVIAGKKVRFWGAAPPGSCRIVEENVLVPAVPEHYEKKKRLICNDAAPVETGPITARELEVA